MSASRVRYDLTIYKGRDFSMNVYFKQLSGDPVNLAGWTGKAQARESVEQTSALLFDFVVTVADAANGKVVVTVSDTKTNIVANMGHWDLLMTDGSGYDDSYIIGIVNLIPVPTVK